MITQAVLIFLSPLLWIKLVNRFHIENWLSPVVLSYATGIVVANFDLIPFDDSFSATVSEVTILLAIPLLLFSTDIRGWIKHAKTTILSFTISVLSGIVASIVMALLFRTSVDQSWIISGMLVGVYTGGTPNMNAIGMALEANQETLVLLNAADIICGGIYLIFLTSVAHRLYLKFLPPFKKSQNNSQIESEDRFPAKGITLKGFLEASGLTILIIGASVGISWLVFSALDNVAFILLLLTTFSVFASLSPVIRKIKGTFEMGEYLLLMFCVAIGMMADFTKLAAEGGMIVGFTALVLSTTIILHLIFSKLFKIDADTVLITSTAAIYGPVFIGQVASVIKNRSLVFSGMATGLIGFAIGNYLGIAVAYFVRWLG
jgi:uncharacterized membrane protein